MPARSFFTCCSSHFRHQNSSILVTARLLAKYL
uniref:Uncharacterized protein n=1 Tax=Anguilla anguilla TaxID=7936 RepID=A0A0E9TST0_ANGAN